MLILCKRREQVKELSEGKGQDEGEGTTYLKVRLVKTQFSKQFGTPNEGL